MNRTASVLVTTALIVFGSGTTLAESRPADTSLDHLLEEFVADYRALAIPEFTLEYVDNFRAIQDLDGLERQASIFEKYQAALKRIPRSSLGQESRYLRDQLEVELRTNCERIALERDLRANHPTLQIPTDGLHGLPHHDRWYALYLARFASRRISPEDVYRLSLEEIAKVKAEIAAIQKGLGYENDDEAFHRHLRDESFFLTRESDVLSAYSNIRNTAFRNLGNVFEFADVPTVDVKPIPHPDKDTPPGYYSDGSFYFNFFGSRHNKRAMDWLFIHEAVPGHHYQGSVADRSRASEFRQLFWYPGFSEGWAAYSEHLGRQVGLYQDPYSQLGKWEWDLVRSTRLAIDVGLHSRGWSKAQALAFWKNHIPNQDDIAEREVDRMIRWPAQVVSYKVGERAIFDLRRRMQQRMGSGFDLKHFHSTILKRGSLPLSLLETIVRDEISKAAPDDGFDTVHFRTQSSRQ